MSWQDDVRRANEALDWIEARQGPLKPEGYARIETDVRTVRAMAEGQDDARIAGIRARLGTARTALGEIDDALEYGSHEDCACDEEEGCPACIVPMARARLSSDVARMPDDTAWLLARLSSDVARMPDDTAWLLARLDALAAERDEWRAKAEQQAQLKADFRAAYQAAQQAGYDMEALRDRAEQERDALAARLAAAEAALRWAERNTTHDLSGHGSNLLRMCRVCDQVGELDQIDHAPDCPFAALAGSRDQVGEGA